MNCCRLTLPNSKPYCVKPFLAHPIPHPSVILPQTCVLVRLCPCRFPLHLICCACPDVIAHYLSVRQIQASCYIGQTCSSMTRFSLVSGFGFYSGPDRQRGRLHAELLGSTHRGGVVGDRLRCAGHKQQVCGAQSWQCIPEQSAALRYVLRYSPTLLGQIRTGSSLVFIPLAPCTAGECNHC